MPKICVAGGGRWGKNHIRTLSELGYLGGICDVDPTNLASFSSQYPTALTFTSLEDAIAEAFDGFVLATPAHTHSQLATRIMRAGFPVLVEKPLALSASDAREMRDVSIETGQSLMVGHLMLFHPAIRKIKELINNGKIGKVQYIYSNRINLGTVRTEENILWSFAPHDISIFQYLLEATPIDITAKGGAFLRPGVHDSTITILTYPDNVICHNYVSWLHPFKEHRVVLIGSAGMLSFDDTDKELLFYEKGIDWIANEPIKRDGPTEQIDFGQAQPLAEELQYFVDHLTEPVEIAGADNAIEVLDILEQATVQLNSEIAQTDSSSVTNNVQVGAEVDTAATIHESAYIDDGSKIGAGTKVWHFSHVQRGALIGEGCSLGQNVNIGTGVKVGNNVRIQNNVSVFEGVEIEDEVFCGPSMTFTNVLNPRAGFPVGSDAYDRTIVMKGASIGANATIVCGNKVGRFSFIAAGAVVTKDVPDHAFMIGVPARQDGWVTEGGLRMSTDDGEVFCSTSNTYNKVVDGELVIRRPY